MDNIALRAAPGTPRKALIVQAIAQALEDALATLPPEGASVRRMTFTFVVEFRDDPQRIVLVDSDVTTHKLRALTITVDGK